MPSPWRSRHPVSTEPKPPRPFWKTWKFYDRVSGVIIGVGLLWWVTTSGNPEEQFTISPETTVVTEPLTASGMVDYAAAIRLQFRHELRSPNNAARLLLQAIGPAAFDQSWQSEQACEQLGVESLPAHGNYFIPLDEVITSMATASGIDQKERERFIWDVIEKYDETPWNSDDAPELAEWVTVNDTSLAKVVAASQMTYSRSPLLTKPGQPLFSARSIYSYEMRQVFRALRLRAMLRISDGDLLGAWDDLHAVHRWGRMMSHEINRIDYIAGTNIAMQAMKSMPALLSSEDMTPDLLSRIRRDWRRLPEWGNPAVNLDIFERYAVLEAMQHTARYGVPYLVSTGLLSREDRVPIAPAIHRLFNACIDWDTSMVYANRRYDELASAAAATDGAVRDMLMDHSITEFEAMREDLRSVSLTTSYVVSGWWVAMLMPLPETIKRHLNTFEAHIALVETVLAIEEYRLIHGTLPTSLADLTTVQLTTVPCDPFSRTEELCYRIEGANAYVLYSVNDDGYDDGGFDEHKDISFRIRMPTPDWLLPDAAGL